LNLNGIKGKKARERGIELLKELNIEHRKDHKPSSLSGGEQQRVAIARALANDPKIIIGDEPTASLDSKNGKIVMELLRKVAKQREKAVIIVTHDSRITDYADRVIWLEDGKINLKHSSAKIVDPVCFMTLDGLENRVSTEYGTIKYEFCSNDCKKSFELNPTMYLKNVNRN
jgi:putative ABC transport system ATP-binding protein